jgi:hypothetical protein
MPSTTRDFWTDVGPWLGVLALALGIAALRPSVPVAVVVLVAAVAAVTERLVRHRRRGLLDAVLVGTGGATCAVGLLAFALAASPVGLTPAALLAGAGLLGVVALGWCVGRPRPPSPVRTYLTGVLPAVTMGTAAVVLTALGLVGAAVGLSVVSTDAAQTPPLAMAATSDGTTVTVEVTAGSPTGPLTIQTVADGQVVVVVSDVTAGPDRPLHVVLAPTPGTRTIVQLVPAGSATPVRGLVLDTQSPSGGS